MADNCITSKSQGKMAKTLKQEDTWYFVYRNQNLRGQGDLAANVFAMQALEPEFESLEPV